MMSFHPLVASDYAQNTRRLTVSGILQASLPEAPNDDGMESEEDQGLLTLVPTQYRPQARAMRVIGHSMDDGSDRSIRHGDIVLVDPQITYSIYHNTRNTVIATQNGYIVKERGMHRGRHLLLSRNPNYPPIRCEPSWQFVGVVYAVYLGPKRVKWL